MRIFRQAASIGIVTMLALAYVHQHVELVKMSYAIQYNEKRVAKLLDRNERLGYTIDNLENPSRLESVLRAQNIDIAMPKRGQIVQVARAAGSARGFTPDRQESVGVEGRFPFNILDFLSLRAEAQARER